MPNDCKGCAGLRAALEDVRSSVEDYVRTREEWVLTEATQKLDKALSQQTEGERVCRWKLIDDMWLSSCGGGRWFGSLSGYCPNCGGRILVEEGEE